MASNTYIEKYPLYNLGISSEEVEHTLKNSAQKADVDVLQERINKIKYYGDADIEISPDEWFVFNDEEHTVLGGFSEGHENETSIVIPYSVTTIGDSAFYQCKSITSVTIPNSVTTICRQAFGDCTHLTSVTISDGVTSIGDDAFRGCSSLTNVIIPNSVRSIGDNAFIDCISLTSVEIPDSVTSIGQLAFFGCISLTSVTIPDRVTSIGEYAFEACTSLTDIYYNGTLEEWNAIVPDHLGIAKSTKIHTLIAKGTCGDNLTWSLNEDYELVIDGIGGTILGQKFNTMKGEFYGHKYKYKIYSF